MRKSTLALSISLTLATSYTAFPSGPPYESLDLETVTRLRDEGFHRSKVMELASELCDQIGPRLTGSPSMKRASQWARKRFEDWGLSNARLESWAPFGQGWSQDRVVLHMLAPDTAPIGAIAKAWTPGTGGPRKAKVVKAKLETDADLEKWKGKLNGLILVLGDPAEIKPHLKADAKRYSREELEDLSAFEIGARDRRPEERREDVVKRREFAKKLRQFLMDEKAVATLDSSRGDDGTVFVQAGGSRRKDEPLGVPGLVIPTEAHGRIARLIDRKVDVELEIDVKTSFHDEDPEAAANTLAEIPGTDKKGEIVMLGAHLDSWHAGTGATDNGAGSVVVMEAVRLLKAIGVKPKRTIRVALWSGEEQGLLGSRAWINKHVASRPESTDPAERDMPVALRRGRGPLTLLPEQAKISSYFNIDNGSGKIRGIYAQENAAAAPILEAWLSPFRDLGATTLTLRNTGGTDHLSFDAVGVPGFQFIQDELDYSSRTHHSNMDVYERLQKEDLMQAAVILASFVYHAAMRDHMLPRKPIPPDPPAVREEEKGPSPKPEAKPEVEPEAKPDAKPPSPTPSPAPSRGNATGGVSPTRALVPG